MFQNAISVKAKKPQEIYFVHYCTAHRRHKACNVNAASGLPPEGTEGTGYNQRHRMSSLSGLTSMTNRKALIGTPLSLVQCIKDESRTNCYLQSLAHIYTRARARNTSTHNQLLLNNRQTYSRNTLKILYITRKSTTTENTDVIYLIILMLTVIGNVVSLTCWSC